MSAITQDAPVESVAAPIERKTTAWGFWLVLGALIVIIAVYVMHVPTPYWVYTFNGEVTSINQNTICIQPDNNERSFITDWLFADQGTVCGVIEIDGFEPATSQVGRFTIDNSIPVGTRVRASITRLTNASGVKVAAYLMISR